MNRIFDRVLKEYEERADAEFARLRDMGRDQFLLERDNLLLSINHETGLLLNVLAREMGARTIVEVGSSYGYSTLWLAQAASASKGRVISLEIHSGKQEYAREKIREVGLEDYVDFRLGDARDSLAAINVPINFALIDLWKDLYIPCWDIMYPNLSPGALVAADNMIFPDYNRHAAESYRSHVRSSSDIQSILLEVGSGIELSRCIRGAEFS